MAKIIRLTAKNGMVKEVPIGTRIRLEAQFAGAKIEVVDAATGIAVASARTRVDGKDVVLSFVEDGEEHEARLEGAAEGTSSATSTTALHDVPLSEDGGQPASEQASDPTTSAAAEQDEYQSGGLTGGTIALGLLGLGALGGVAAAAGGGGKGGGSGGDTPPRDVTPPTATISLSDTNLAVGETALVTITFSEAVVDFSNADLDVQGGQLSTVSSSDGGRTWTGTFIPTPGLSDVTNVITLGTGYRDAAGNAGQGATSANYAIDTLTFTVSQTGNSISFGGTATGPITITLNAQNQAVFSRGGASASTTIDSISTKVLDVPKGGTLNLVLEPGATADTFTINSPNAATINVTGSGGALADTLAIIIASATANPELRTMTLNTSGLTGVEAINFIFPDALDVVELTADSVLTGFTTIEVSKGTADLRLVNITPGTEFIVNSGLVLTLDQFKAMTSLVSVTGLGKLTINLTEAEVLSGALEAFLNDPKAAKPILIGAEVTVKDPSDQSLPLPAGLDEISFLSIPGLQAAIEALQAQIGTIAIADIAGLVTALTDLNDAVTALQTATGGTSVSSQITAAIGAPSVADDPATADVNEAKPATGLWADIESALAAAVSGLQTQITAIQSNTDGVTLNSIAELKAAIELLNGLETLEGSVGYSIADAIGVQSNATANPPVKATGLWADIEAALATVTGDLEGQINAIKNDAAGENAATLDSIAGLKAAVTELKTALGDGTVSAQLAALETTIQGYIDALQSQIDGIVKPSLIEGNELDNIIQLYSYQGQQQLLRVEAGAGDDRIDSANLATQLVGGAGADVINLTWTDNSTDKVLYQTVTDGQVRDVKTVTFSDAALEYREGSVLTLRVNDSEYSYTVTADDGETPQVALEGLAAVLRSKLMAADTGAAVIGFLYNPLNTEEAPANVTYSELTDALAYQVPYGKVFVPASAIVNNENASSVEFIAFFGINGGETFTLTTEKVYDFTFNNGGLVVMTPEAMTTWLAANPQDPVLTLSDLLVPTEDVLSGVTISGTTLKLYGADGVALEVQAGGDTEAAIVNPGMVTSYDVTFPSDVALWPTATNGDNTTAFSRQLTITIGGGEPITAAVVYDENTGAPDPAASVAALADAINAANIDGLADVVASGTTLTLFGAAEPQVDGDAPTFTVDSATLDQNGVQQETLVRFSANDADYYDGGTLSVTIAGKEISASMVAGDATASVSNLITAVQQAKDVGERSVVFQFRTDIDASTVLNNLQGASRYAIDIVIGGVTVSENTSYDAADKPETVGELVSYLNVLFDDVAVFSLDEVTNQITASTPANNAVTAPDGVAAPSLFLAFPNEAGDSYTFESKEGTVSVSKLDAIESAELSAGYQVLRGFSTSSGPPLAGSQTVTYIDAADMVEAVANGALLRVTNATIRLSDGREFSFVSDQLYSSLSDWAADAQVYWRTALKDGALTVSYNPGSGVLTIDPTDLLSTSQTYVPAVEAVKPTWDVRLTAATEAPDPLQVKATLDYEGEYQQATVSLEDEATYNAYVDGTETTRGADVYYEGGKAYVTIKPLRADDLMTGHIDESASVTVSADMVEGTGGVALIEGTYGFTLNATEVQDPNPYVEFSNGEKITFATGDLEDYLVLLNAAPEVASAELLTSGDDAGKIRIEAVEGLSIVRVSWGVYNLPSADRPVDFTYPGYVDSQILPPNSAADLTSSALVAAIKAEAAEGGALYGVIAVDGASYKDGVITLTAANPGKETFEVSEVTLDYQGVKQLATISLETATDYTRLTHDETTLTADRGADVYFADGKVYATIAPVAPDGTVGEGVTVSALMGADAAATTANLVTAINTAATTGALVGIIESASVDANGLITLTAANAGDKTFEVTDVRLDYEGVQQLASFELDTATTYTVSSEGNGFTDTSAVTQTLDVFEIRVADKIVDYFDALVARGTSHATRIGLKLTFTDAEGVITGIDFIERNGSATPLYGVDTPLDFASQVSWINDDLTAVEAQLNRELGSVTYENGLIRVVAAPGLNVIGGLSSDNFGYAFDVSVQDREPEPDLPLVYFKLNGDGALVSSSKGPLYPNLTPEQVIALAPVSGTNTVEVVTGGRGLADVYYEGGKAYVTIAPIDDPDTPDVDESVANAVTVSADMGTDTPAVLTLKDFATITPTDRTYVEVRVDGFPAVYQDISIDGKFATPQDIALSLATKLDGKALVTFQGDDLVITTLSQGPSASVMATGYGYTGDAFNPTVQWGYSATGVLLSVADSKWYTVNGLSAVDVTTQNLVDAINDQINGYETPAVVSVGGTVNGTVTGAEVVTGTDLSDNFTTRFVLSFTSAANPNLELELKVVASTLADTAFVIQATARETDPITSVVTSTRLSELYFSIAEYDAGVRFTLDDLVAFANEQTFEGQPLPFTLSVANGKLNVIASDADQGQISVEILGHEADAVLHTQDVFKSEALGWTPQTYTDTPDTVEANPTLSALLESATLAADGTITLTGNDRAQQSFSISDVTLDYTGVQQMAQASFSAVDADYYAGGKLRIVVDTTPDIADGPANDVVVEADMVAGDAAQSVQNLVDAINDKIVTTVPSNDASVAIGSGFTESTVVHNGTSGYFALHFFVTKDGVTESYVADVYTSTNIATFEVFKNDGSSPFYTADQTSGPKTLSEFIAWVNSQTFIDLPVTFSITAGGSIVATADDPSLGVTVGLQAPFADGLLFLPVVNADTADGFFTETATPEQQVPGELGGVLSSVTYENGVITLTSKDNVKEQFTITDAEIDYLGVKQQATADFSSDNADYFAGGEVSLTVNGLTFTEAMVDNDQDATLTALTEQITAAITGETLSGVESVSYSGGTITFTAASPENGTGEINITAVTINIPAITQVTEVDMSSVTFETREGSEGAPAINLTVGGVALTTASGVDDADSVRNMAQAVIEARDGIYTTAAATTTTGVDGNGNPVAIIGGAGDLQLTDTLAYDVIRFSLTVNGTAYDLEFMPELKTTASSTGSPVEDFITYVNVFLAEKGEANAFAALVDGDIRIGTDNTGTGVTGDVTFATLVGDKTITSLASGEFGVGVDAVTPEGGSVETPATLAIKLLSDPNANITSYNLTFVLTVDGTPSTLTLADPSVSPSNTKIEGLLVTLNAAPELNGLSFSYDAAAAEILVTSDAVGTGVSISVDDRLLISTNNFPQAIDYTGGTVSGGSVDTLPAEPAVVVLEEFSGLHLTTAVLDGSYDFSFTVEEGVLAEGGYNGLIGGQFTAQNSTVADLLEYLNGLSPEVGATLTDAGIEIFSTRTGADVTLTVNEFDLTTVNAGTEATLSDVVGAVNYVPGTETFSIEAAVPGADPLQVSGISYATEDTERTSVKQVVELLFFGDGTVDSLAVGSTVTLNLGAVSVSYTVTGQESGDLSTAIAAALVSQLNESHAGLVSASASTLTGSADTSLVTLTAAVTGPDILGSVDDSTLSVSITGPSGASITAAALSETVAGEVYFTTSGDFVFIYDETGESEIARTGADRGTLAYDDSSYTLNGATLEQGSPFETLLDINDAAVTGEADDPIDQTITNPIDDALFYGDAPQLGADDKGVLTGGGVSQSFTNPGDAYVANSGSAATGTSGSGDATYYGDAALLGEDEEGTLTGDGVLQSFTNPDSEYAATSGSPASGTVDTSEGAGDATFFGDDAVEGSIDLETGVFDGLGVDQTYTNPSSGYDALAGSPAFNDAGANVGDPTLEGVSPGTYDETDTLTYDDGSASTTVDKIDVGDGSVTGDGGFTGESETTITDATADDDVFKVVQTEKGFAAFDWDEATVTIQSTASTGPDVVNDFQVGHDVITLEGELAASTFYDGTVDEIVDIEVIEAISGFLKLPDPQVAFDLSANEFGLVSSSANRVLDASSIGIAEDVAGLLNSVFDFADQSGGTSDNGLINTTIFAVTASDDASVTAIWAHTQSSSGDSTVEHVELNLLATVNTIDGQFGLNNLDILQVI